jgi:hypothetical protein
MEACPNRDPPPSFLKIGFDPVQTRSLQNNYPLLGALFVTWELAHRVGIIDNRGQDNFPSTLRSDTPMEVRIEAFGA